MPRLPLLLSLPLVPLAVSCSSLPGGSGPPSTARVGGLTLENRLDATVVVAAKWYDEAQEQHCAFEVILPGRGHETHHVQEDPLPAGLTLDFAVRGAGFAAFFERCTLVPAAALRGARDDVDYRLRGDGTAMISRTRTSKPNDEGALPGAQAAWTVRGGAVLLVIESDDAGGIRLSER